MGRMIPYVYCAGVFDMLHYGHLKFLHKSSRFGNLIVGLVSDESAEAYKGEKPILTFAERKKAVEELPFVWKVVKYSSKYDDDIGIGFRKAIRRWRPMVVTHGKDWGNGTLIGEKEVIINALDIYGGQLIELPYTKSISDTEIRRRIRMREYYVKKRH